LLNGLFNPTTMLSKVSLNMATIKTYKSDLNCKFVFVTRSRSNEMFGTVNM